MGKSYSHPLAHRECCPAWLGHMGKAVSHAPPKEQVDEESLA